MEEEAGRPAPWKVISTVLVAGVVILAVLSGYLFFRPEAEEIVPICPTNYEWDPDTGSCILSDTFAPTGVSSPRTEVTTVGEILSFDGGGSTDDVGVAEWMWDFGDGTGATGKTVDKTYHVPGSYIVSLVVRDAGGNEGTNEASFTRVTVLPTRTPFEVNGTAPVAFLAVDEDVIEAGDEVLADASGSWVYRWVWTNFTNQSEGGDFEAVFWDPTEFQDAMNLTIDFDFGDGATATGTNKTTHTYTKAGNYALRITVTGWSWHSAREAWVATESFYIDTIHVLAEPEVYPGEIKNPDTIIVSTISEGEHLDPGRSYDTSSDAVLRMVYEPLIQWDRDSLTTLKPILATQVPTVGNGISDDLLNYTFSIRQGVKFHNGDTLDAYDVEYTFERNMVMDMAGGPMWLVFDPLLGLGAFDASTNPDPANITQATFDAWVQANITRIKNSVEVIDQFTVRFTLDHVDPTFLAMMAGGNWALIMNKDYMIDEKDQWDMSYDLASIREYNRAHDEHALHGDEPGDLVGTGPFKFKSWELDVQIVTERFDDYWREPAQVKFVVRKNVPEWGTRKLMFQNGDTDFVFVPTVFREQVVGLPDIISVSGLPTLSMAYAGFNLDISNVPANPDIGTGMLDGDGIPTDFFQDVNIRRAFSWLIDYDEYIETAWRGLAQQPFGPIPEGLLGYTDQGPKYSFDLAEAEAEFKASAWMEDFDNNGEPDLWDLGFKFTILYNEGNDLRRIASEMISENLKIINPLFDTDVQSVPWGEYLGAMIEGRTTLAVIGWRADFADPHNFAVPFMRSEFGAFSGWFSYENATIDDLIDAAARETDPAVREQMYFDLQEANFWDPPGVWLYQPQVDEFYRDWITGWYYNPITTPYYYDYGKG